MSLPIAISNTSPILFLYRIDAFYILPQIFSEIWVPDLVRIELLEGRIKGHLVPDISEFLWIKIANPKSMPSEWLTLDLGKGELAAMSLAFENPDHIILLDDRLARRTAQFAGLNVWGTLKILVTAKNSGIITSVEPFLHELIKRGMWISDDILNRILILAGEKPGDFYL